MIPGISGDLIATAFLEHELRLDAGAAMRPFQRKVHRWWRAVSRALGPASGIRAIADIAATPLLTLLGHHAPVFTSSGDRMHADVDESRCAIVVVPWVEPLSSAWRYHPARSHTRAAWLIACNGHSLRVADATRPWSRAGLEFDFAALVSTPQGMAALHVLLHAAATSGTGPSSLDGYRAASDAFGIRVCRSLSDAVLAHLPQLAEALPARAAKTARAHAAFDQSLTIIYRILFLLFAEARGLVPMWHEVYRDAYSIAALVDRAMQSNRPGLWKSLQAIARLAHAGGAAGDLHVTAFNGRLFSPHVTPLALHGGVSDAVIRELLLALATVSTRSGRRKVSYHDLGVEQLGSVYERVLDYAPPQGATGASLERTSIQRKVTGSFYTPQSLTEFLVRRTLAPLVHHKRAAEILALRIVDPAMGSGAFLVAATRYLSHAVEEALIAEGAWNERRGREHARADIRRAVAEQCLYGVDLNPTAVQLARLSLWLTTLAADKPLTFLDHHLACGNSLVGARLADLARQPRAMSRRHDRAQLPLFDDRLAGQLAEQVLPLRLHMALEPSDSVEAVKHKERLLGAATHPLEGWARAADCWTGAALSTGAPVSSGLLAEWFAHDTGGATHLSTSAAYASSESARQRARAHGAFHWELAFPEVFFDPSGHRRPQAGFDAVLGNPPWEMMRADTGDDVVRQDTRAQTAEAIAFCRRSGTFTLVGTGQPNRYQLFVERALQLTRPGGRVGLLVPSGIATDHGSGALRLHLLDRTNIDTWIGFDNRRRIFPIHRSVRFVVMATTTDAATPALRVRSGITDTDALLRDDVDRGALIIARSRLETWSPGNLAIPDMPDADTLAIVTAIRDRVATLGDPSAWQARFGRELNATDDRPHFDEGRTTGPSWLPIVEGKHLAPFQADVLRSTLRIRRKVAATLLDAAAFNRPRIAYRDIASATNRLTLIAAMLPRGVVSTHTVFTLKSDLDAESQWCLLALLNSLVANYLVRLQVTTHVTTALMSRLPVPRPARESRSFRRLGALARSLAASGITDESVAYAELNAIAARLYGISREQYAVVLKTFPLLPAQLREQCLRAYATGPDANGFNSA